MGYLDYASQLDWPSIEIRHARAIHMVQLPSEPIPVVVWCQRIRFLFDFLFSTDISGNLTDVTLAGGANARCACRTVKNVGGKWVELHWIGQCEQFLRRTETWLVSNAKMFAHETRDAWWNSWAHALIIIFFFLTLWRTSWRAHAG